LRHLFPAKPAGNTTLCLGGFGLDFAVYLVDFLHGGLGSVVLVLLEFSFGFGEFGAGLAGLWNGS